MATSARETDGRSAEGAFDRVIASVDPHDLRLDDVSQAVEVIRLGPRSNHRIDPERHRFRSGQRIHRDGEPIGQDVHLGAHGFGRSSRNLRLTANP